MAEDIIKCAFCQRLEMIYLADLSRAEEDAAVEALFDQAARALHARRVSGRRRGRWSGRAR